MIPYPTIGKWVGGILGGLIIGWIFYAGLIRPVTKPNPSTTQSGETINNYYNTPRISFGCARFEVKNDKPVSVPVSDDSK